MSNNLHASLYAATFNLLYIMDELNIPAFNMENEH